jgi:hypothetical protein
MKNSTILQKLKNTFLWIIGVLGLIITTAGVCFPDFFKDNAIVLMTSLVTFLLVSGFWFVIIATPKQK